MDTNRLDELCTAIKACRICRDSPKTTPLPHEPRPVVMLSATARICIAGQAPGIRVHNTGIPFNDPSGDRLRDWMGVDRDTFYDQRHIAIVPMGFCFPGYDAKGGDLPPRKECAAEWRDAIFETQPQLTLILVIGQYAQKYHLGADCCRTLTRTVQNGPIVSRNEANRCYFPLPHPSWRNSGWLKRNPWFEAEILPLLKREVAANLNRAN